ncbi:unnamed protein product [Paramecium sonneborni]|uniref:Uncharacterized protein n=1 Tax=Paramecium sonneborni TaxID=65129 RepID=A0A8S1LZ57_9CILI|nr:unnamed protein product [Paramecium sonneborni]
MKSQCDLITQLRRSRQHLRKSERIFQLGLCHENQKSKSQNMKTFTTEKLFERKKEIPKRIKLQEKGQEIKQNEKDLKQTMKGMNNKVQKLRYSKKLAIDEDYLSSRNKHKQELQLQKKKILIKLQENQDAKQDGQLKKQEEQKEQEESKEYKEQEEQKEQKEYKEQREYKEYKEVNQNQEQQDFILDMIALENRFELRNEFEWKNHEFWNELDNGNNNLFKMQHEESYEQDSIFCYSFFSNDNYKLENYTNQKKKIGDKNQKLIQKIEKLEEQYSQNYDSNKVKLEDNNQSQKENENIQRNQQINQNIADKQQKLEDNQRNGVSRLIKILKREDEYSPLKQDEESQETNNFSHFLSQARYENSSRDSCKEIYKLMRQQYDKFCVDYFMIDLIWSEIKHSNELSYLQFLKCIQDMHKQDLLWFDEQGKKVYLI